MSDTQIVDVRIIGDNGQFLDMNLPIKDFSTGSGQFALMSYPGQEVIDTIKKKLCSPGCDCAKHEYYRIRDIYGDGNCVLEVFVEQVKQ
jgi:hypothetical protein